MAKKRIQKLLAQAGYGSRRACEALIAAGRIKVNQRVAQLGDFATTDDHIALDDKPCNVALTSDDTRVLLYHKPLGEVCTRHDPQRRKTVFATLPAIANGRWLNVGRLDFNTTGLLLFTNNGELVNRLMRPQSRVEREYAVRILGSVDATIIKRLVTGVRLDDGWARFEDVVDAGGGGGANRWFYVVVVAGRNRLVRRLWQSQGLQVSRLVRVRLGPIFLPKSLRPGKWLELEANDIAQL